jgi:hypothetical protein
MKKKIIWFFTILIGASVGFFGIKACVDFTASARAEVQERRAEKEASITPLTEKEMELWTEVYSAAVRRGVWYPAERANNAIIELRKMQGASNGQ